MPYNIFWRHLNPFFEGKTERGMPEKLYICPVKQQMFNPNDTMKNLLLLFVWLLAACHSAPAFVPQASEGQPASTIVTSDLSNQKINALAEDAQGHIWMGTFRGLNKYNVYEYHQYFCNDDSLSLPDNQVNDLFRDSQGRLWVATVNGICQYTEKDNFHHIPIDFANKNGHQLLENKKGRIFLNMVVQLCVFNPEKEQFECVFKQFDPHFFYNGRCHIDSEDYLWDVKPFALRRYDSSTLELKDSIPTRNFPTYSYLHNGRELWLAGQRSLDLLDTRTCQYKPLPEAVRECRLLMESTVSQIHPYGAGGLLFYSTDNGLFYYNAIEQTVLHQSENGFPFEAPRFRISRMFTDSQKNLWIGSTDQGYSVVYHYKERFNRNSYLRTTLEHKSVVALATDGSRHLWISTLMDGLYLYDLQKQKVSRVKVENAEKREITALFVDNTDALWLAAKHNQVLKCRYENGKLRVEQKHTLPMPMNITQDDKGTIWVSSASPLIYALRPGEASFTSVSPLSGPTYFTFIPTLLPHSSGQLFVAAFHYPLYQLDTGTRQVEKLPVKAEEWANCIRRSVFIPTVLYEDNRREVWIGTVGNGLLKYTPSTRRMEPVPGIPCTDISSIEEDGQGDIWVGTMYGLSRYDRATGRFTNYYAADGIGGNQFYDRASCQLTNGTLIFGGTHGLTLFQPIDVQSKREIPLLFEDLKVHNRLVQPQDGEDACITRHLSYRPDIHLDYRQNGFSISFAALDYCEFERVHYYYQLEGFDKYWVDANNNREAYYANLPAGSYTFRVRITNNDKSIVEAENSIRVVIAPAPWATWWARLLYLLTAATIIGLFLRARLRVLREKEATRRAQLEREQEQRINRMNMSFFANISHEFRTPLTMIAGPVTQLCETPTIQGGDKKLLYIVQRSVVRMLRLVNQLMDFNKLENDTLRLKVRRTDIIEELRRYVDVFAVSAEEKGITFATYGLEDAYCVWLDADKLDKIVGNLLSNALKFTPRGGKIELCLDADATHVKITVADTGCGIPEGQEEKIFERYYQADNRTNSGRYNWGTGIGLYYARALARLHHGSLQAANRPEGGALFTLLLPTAESSYTEQERASDEKRQNELFPLQATAELTAPPASEESGKPLLLVVDDDAEVVHYLEALLTPGYRVISRFDADSAFKAVQEEAPALVLSDVVMPGETGYDLCRRLKEDLQLCHIPVVLLTAKATVKEQVEGLDFGADAYVTKPFEPSYLLALIKSQLKNREKIRALLGRSTQTDEQTQNVLSPQDNAFMTTLYQLMEAELSNPELDVNRLTEMLHISRTKFYYKVKGLTGETPATFFKTYKLNRAAEMIREGKYTFAEIADRTGFSTPSVFSSNFKKQFGVAPSEY